MRIAFNTGRRERAEDTPDVSHDSWIEKYRAVCVRSAGISRAAANEACGARGVVREVLTNHSCSLCATCTAHEIKHARVNEIDVHGQ